jgi:hypothetical protein
MTDTTPEEPAGDQPPRDHPQEPAEGVEEDISQDGRTHAQDPAEGADDSSATS